MAEKNQFFFDRTNLRMRDRKFNGFRLYYTFFPADTSRR